MKTWKVILAVFIAAVSFSSCLGDGESSLEASDFGYVKKHDKTYQIYVATASGLALTWDGINSDPKIVENRAVTVRYKVDLTQGTEILKAEFGTVEEEFRYTSHSFNDTSIPETIVDEIPAVSDFGVYRNRADDLLGDRWVFSLSPALKEGERFVAYFYLDPNGQYETVDKETGEPKPLTGNQKIIDVRFATTKDTNPDLGVLVSEDNGAKRFVANLSQMRNFVTNPPAQDIDKNYNFIQVPVKFRYKRWTSAEKKEWIDAYIGEWSTSESQVSANYRFFRYAKPGEE